MRRENWTPTLVASPLRCPQRGSRSRLGTVLRREIEPPRLWLRHYAAPKGGADRALGRSCGAKLDPHACGFATTLPRKGEQVAPWHGPAARSRQGGNRDRHEGSWGRA